MVVVCGGRQYTRTDREVTFLGIIIMGTSYAVPRYNPSRVTPMLTEWFSLSICIDM